MNDIGPELSKNNIGAEQDLQGRSDNFAPHLTKTKGRAYA